MYKFRRADVVLYREIRDGLAQRGAAIVQLTTSFRALRPIQHLVNAAFEAEMQDDVQAVKPLMRLSMATRHPSKVNPVS